MPTRDQILGTAIVAFLSTSFTLPLNAQDLGLLADEATFISLSVTEKLDTVSNYGGVMSRFDLERGFVHQELQGEIDRSKGVLKLEVEETSGNQLIEAAYKLGKMDGNTAWFRMDECEAECFQNLSGTTFKTDPEALKLLRYWEQDLTNRSVPIADYVEWRTKSDLLCNLGQDNYCPAPSETVGMVLKRSKTPSIDVVAKALGKELAVATFAANDFDGALVATSPEVIDAIYKFTGPKFFDDYIDFSEVKVIGVNYSSPPDVHINTFDLLAEDTFLHFVVDASKDEEDVNDKLKDFSVKLPGDSWSCQFVQEINSKVLDCFLHSSDLENEIDPVWVRLHTTLVVSKLEKSLKVFLVTHISIKYDVLDKTPKLGSFKLVNYRDGNEKDLAEAALASLSRAIANHFRVQVASGG